MESNGKQSWSSVAGGGRKAPGQTQSSIERERIFHELQDAFKGQLEADIVYMLLAECDWKVDEAVEKLLQLSNGNTSPRPGGLTMKSIAQTINSDHRQMGQHNAVPRSTNSGQPPQQQNLHLDLKSRLPSVGGQSDSHSDALRVLSPRTPGTASTGDMNFPNFPLDQNTDNSFRTALTALDSYANSSFSYGTGYNSGAPINYGVWDFDPSGSSSAMSNIPPPPLTESSLGNFGDAPPNPFSSLPGINTFNIPVSSSSTAVTESSQLFTTSTSSSLLRPSSPRTNHNSVYSEGSYNSPHRLSSVSSGITSPFTPLNSAPPDFSAVTSNAAQTPSRQSSSGSNEGPVQALPLSSKETTVQRLRNYNMSLNATERESLEKLIEEVIIGGVDQGFVDSEGTTSEEDESSDSKKVKKDSDSSGKEGTAGKPKEGKLYGSQMKVAAKHMKNLPPRFARRIQAAQKHADANNAAAADKKVTSPEDERKPKARKKTGGLLEGIDSYFDEDEQLSPRAGQDSSISELFDSQPTPDALQNLMLGDLSALATPPLVPSPKLDTQDVNRTPNSQIASQPKGNSVMNCEDLEKDLTSTGAQARENVSGYIMQSQFPEPPQVHRLAGTQSGKVIHSDQYMSLSEADRQKLSGFSVNAPEFVPRSVTPTKFSVSQAQQQIMHITPPPAPPPPPTHPVVLQQTPVAASTVTASIPHPQVTLLDSRHVVAPVVSQTFAHPPPPTKVAVNRSGQFHAPLGRMSPQLIPHVTAATQGRHSPTPAFILPKQPSASGSTQSAAVAVQAHAAALQAGAVPGLIQYAQAPYAVAFPTPPPPSQPPPSAARYAAAYAYTRPPFLPPTAPYPATWAEKPPPTADKLQARAAAAAAVAAHKDQMWAQAANQQVYTSIALPVSTQSTRMAANFQPNTVLNRGNTKLKSETVKQQPHQQMLHSKEGAALVAATGSPLQLAMEKPVQKVDRLVKEGVFVMVILRGLPGSGKSSLAKEMKKDGIVLTTDDYFIAENGQYKYDFSKLGEAHEFNQKRAKLAVDSKINPIIIDNTNTQQWEMKYYISLASKGKYHIEIFEPETSWKFKPKECFRKNVHNIPLDRIQRMSDRYEHNVTVDSILKSAEKVKEEASDVQTQHQQQEQQQQPDAGQSEKPEEPAAQPHKKSTRKRKRRKKKKNRELKDAEAEKPDGKEEKEGVSSDEEESTPDREQHVQKQILKRDKDSSLALPTVEEKPTADEEKTEKTVEDTSSAPVIENLASQTQAEETEEVTKAGLSEAIDVINNNSKKDTEPSSPKSDNVESSPVVKENRNSEEIQDLKPEETDEVEEKLEAVAVKDDVCEQEAEAPSSSDSDVEGRNENSNDQPEQQDTQKKPNDGMSGAASEEDNAVSGTDSGGVGTPRSRRHSEIHLDEPDMLKKVILTTWKEIRCMSSTGSDSETQEEKCLALRRKLYQRRVSESLISEIEEILKDKILDHIINDEVAAITGPPEEATAQPAAKVNTNPAEKAYWTKENSEDRYLVSVDSNEAMSTAQTCTEEQGENTWNEQGSSKKEQPEHSSTPSDTDPRSQRQPRSPHRKRQANASVALDENVKEQLEGADVEVPEVQPSHTTEDMSAETTSLEVAEETQSVGTYTHPKDFSNLQRLIREDLKLTEEDGFIAMVDAQPREISDTDLSVTRSASQTPTFDKSCMVEETMLNSDSLPFLQNCFPAVDASDLEEVLSRCEGDVQWATNILLDSSLEYNEPLSARSENLNGDHNYAAVVPAEIPTEKLREGVIEEDSSRVKVSVYNPPPLAVFCYAALPQATVLQSDDVQKSFCEGSVLRVKSITEFRRQHSKPAELEDETSKSKIPPFALGGFLRERVLVAATERDSSTERDAEQSAKPASDSLPGQDEHDGHISTEALDTQQAIPYLDAYLDEDDAEVEEELWEAEETDVTLELPPSVARQLINIFGPVSFHISPDSLSAEDLSVRLDRGVARSLHRCLGTNLHEKFLREEQSIDEMIRQDQALARRLQAEENRKGAVHAGTPTRLPLAAAGASTPSPSRLTPVRRPDSPWGENSGPSSPTENFRFILREEAVIDANKRAADEKSRRALEFGKRTMTAASKLKLLDFYKKFPSLDPETLDEIFQAKGCRLDAAVSAVYASLGRTEPVKNVYASPELKRREKQMIREAEEASRREYEAEMGGASGPLTYLSDPTYTAICENNSAVLISRTHNISKAKEYARHGHRGLTDFYGVQVRMHSVKLEESNKEATDIYLELQRDYFETYDRIDLHSLVVPEALAFLDECIVKREREIKSGKRPNLRRNFIYVITGWGRHSPGGKAKVKPAVHKHLRRRNYSFEPVQEGEIKLKLKC